MRIRRKSLTDSVGINDRRPVKIPDDSIPGEVGADGTMARSGQPGIEFQRPV